MGDRKCVTVNVVAPMPPPAPKFEIVKINVDKNTIHVNETVNVQVWVKNTGNAAGHALVQLNVDGVKKAQKSVHITAGSFEAVSFNNIRVGNVGVHTICAVV